jgi:hypothetical protein
VLKILCTASNHLTFFPISPLLRSSPVDGKSTVYRNDHQQQHEEIECSSWQQNCNHPPKTSTMQKIEQIENVSARDHLFERASSSGVAGVAHTDLFNDGEPPWPAHFPARPSWTHWTVRVCSCPYISVRPRLTPRRDKRTRHTRPARPNRTQSAHKSIQRPKFTSAR